MTLPSRLKSARLATMRIKLLALDIDGTLLNSQNKLTERTRASVQSAVEAGVKVVLVTGRRFHAARSVAQDLQLQLPIITHNGALTKCPTTLEILNYYPLEPTLAQELVLLGREFSADTLCCDDPQGEGLLVYDNISAENTRLRYYMSLFKQYTREVADLHNHIVTPPIQIFYVGPCALMDALQARLETQFAGRAKVVLTTYRSADMTIVDVIHPSSSKGNALASLAQHLGIDSTEVMAMGDNHNDLEMLQYAGLPVMMANAESILHNRGFATTVSNDEDGVALAIEQYIFERS